MDCDCSGKWDWHVSGLLCVLCINHWQQGSRYLTQKESVLSTPFSLKPQGSFSTLIKALIPTKSSVCCRKKCGALLSLCASDERHTLPVLLSRERGKIPSDITSSDLLHSPCMNSSWEVLSTPMRPVHLAHRTLIARQWGKNPEAGLYKKTQEGGGRFLLPSAATKDMEVWQAAVKCLLWSSALRFVLLRCCTVCALTTTSCYIPVSSCISAAPSHPNSRWVSLP